MEMKAQSTTEVESWRHETDKEQKFIHMLVFFKASASAREVSACKTDAQTSPVVAWHHINHESINHEEILWMFDFHWPKLGRGLRPVIMVREKYHRYSLFSSVSLLYFSFDLSLVVILSTFLCSNCDIWFIELFWCLLKMSAAKFSTVILQTLPLNSKLLFIFLLTAFFKFNFTYHFHCYAIKTKTFKFELRSVWQIMTLEECLL